MVHELNDIYQDNEIIFVLIFEFILVNSLMFNESFVELYVNLMDLMIDYEVKFIYFIIIMLIVNIKSHGRIVLFYIIINYNTFCKTWIRLLYDFNVRMKFYHLL